MVAGDLVNTAARVQSAAAPGTVFVTDGTRRASEAAVVYDDGGTHDLKGKAEPLHLSRAVRVIAGRMGALRSAGLESPFVGRDREFRLVKDLFHATADERRAHLLSVHGIAGIGKSRIAWEFEKYVDGVVDDVYWHRGRCIPYGEGVSFWALAEMVRMRVGIAEEEDPSDRRGEAGGRAGDVDRRRGGAPLHRAAARGAPRLRRRRDRGQGGPLGGVADVLRADRRAGTDRSGLRGSAMGRRRAAGLHPDDARSLARPAAVRRDAVSSRAAGTPRRLGDALTRLHLAAPGAAVGCGDGRLAGRDGPRHAGGAPRADPRLRRGDPPVRGRDRPDAAGPGRVGPHGRPVRAGGRGRPARCAGVPARVDRRPAGRAPRGGAIAPAGRVGPRQDVPPADAGRGGRDDAGGGPAVPRRPRPQGAAQRPAGPAIAGARSVRLPPVAGPEGRARHAREEGPANEAPRDRRAHRVVVGGRRGRDRGGRRRASPRRVRAGPRRAGRSGDPGEGGRGAREGRATSRGARRDPPRTRLLRTGRRVDAGHPHARRVAGARRRDGAHERLLAGRRGAVERVGAALQ